MHTTGQVKAVIKPLSAEKQWQVWRLLMGNERLRDRRLPPDVLLRIQKDLDTICEGTEVRAVDILSAFFQS